ncbi:MAG: FAD-binding oxidoreductase, partial [Rhodospirillales bacterium]|nr:FAD-binding oxidoreductase [Rhodospirillales bacterium]
MPEVSNAVRRDLETVVGATGIFTDPADLEAHLVDERGAFRGVSPVLLKPATTDEVVAIVRICADAGVGIVPQGGRTGLCGGTVPVSGGGEVLVSLERLRRIRELDAQGFTMTCEAGCILQTLQQEAESADRLFPLSLAAEGSCTIGGNLSTNAGGINVLRYGMARNLTLGLEVVLPDGTLWDDLGALRKDNRGYDLKQLFIDAEGTLGIITAATMELFPRPRDVDTAFLAVADPEAALQLFAVAREVAADMMVAFELNDRNALDMVFQHMDGVRDPFPTRYSWYVLLELTAGVDGHARAAGEQILAAAFQRGLVLDGVRADSLAHRAGLWRLRETVTEAQKH